MKPTEHSPEHFSARAIDWPTFIISGGFLIAFVIMAIVDIDYLSSAVNVAYAASANTFGLYWQVLLLSTFGVGLYVALSPSGKARLGNLAQLISSLAGAQGEFTPGDRLPGPGKFRRRGGRADNPRYIPATGNQIADQ